LIVSVMIGGMPLPPLRPATHDDLPGLVETARQCFETYREWAPRGWDPPGTDLHAAGLRGRLAERGSFCAIAEADGEPAGQVGTSPAREERGTGHVWMLFVRERWWGSGLAVKLLEAALADARARGLERMRLLTPSEHARARAFYEREGWTTDADPVYEPMLGLVLITYRRDLPAFGN
jgi:GNAT superfamily N-acetyltransferase